MKKLLCFLSISIIATVALLGTAYAYPTLPSPEWKIKFQNYEYFNPDLESKHTLIDIPNNDFQTIAEGNVDPDNTTEDNWGIAQVTNILEGIGSSSTPSWDFNEDKYQIYAIFGGLSVTSWNTTTTINTDGTTTTAGGFKTEAATVTADGDAVTPFIEFYLWDETSGDFTDWATVAAQGTAGRTGAYEYTGISDGSAQLLAAFDLVSGIDSTDGNVLTSGSANADNPPTGVGSGYANVDYSKSGLWTDQITQGYWPTAFGDRDAKLLFNFDTDTDVADWDLASDDPFEGGAVPEPATMMLLGFGLLGIAAVGRKR